MLEELVGPIYSSRNCEHIWILFSTNPAHIESRWLPALWVKPSLPISLPMGPCPFMTTRHCGKRRCWKSQLLTGQLQELVQEGCELAEYWWEPASHLKNAPEQVITSHWANQGKSRPHAIILGQLTHTLCGRWPKKMSHRPQGLIWGIALNLLTSLLPFLFTSCSVPLHSWLQTFLELSSIWGPALFTP